MSRFAFLTDGKSAAFCDEIVAKMVELFRISENEAVGRLNREFQDMEFVGEEHVFYHEDDEYWANRVYWGHGSKWWLNPPGLQPVPYP